LDTQLRDFRFAHVAERYACFLVFSSG
jgi:hypothetical protein